jgi:hypothetical protein
MSPSAATKENGVAAVSKTSETKETLQVSQKITSNTQVTSTRKVATLRDVTQRSVAVYRSELGSSSEQFLASCQSVETFFDAIASIRLRQMPHHSSRWDKVLKWAEFFAAQVQGYSEEVSQFADYADQAARIIWASSLALIQVFHQDILCIISLITLRSWDQNIFLSWKRHLASSTAVV